MEGPGIDPPGRTQMPVLSSMCMTGKEIMRLRGDQLLDLPGQVAMGNRDPSLPQLDRSPEAQARPADGGHRGSQRPLIVVVVAEDEITWDKPACMNDVRAGEITAMDQGFGTHREEGVHGSLSPFESVVSV